MVLPYFPWSLIPDCAARQTRHFVHTNQATAVRTGPSRLFARNKLVKPDLANGLEIFEHTHAVLGSVTFVELLQPLAWECFTVTAERQIAS